MHVRGAPDSSRIGQQHCAQPDPGGAFQADNQRYFSKSEGCENARCDAAVLRGAQLFGAAPQRRTDPPHIGGSRQAGTTAVHQANSRCRSLISPTVRRMVWSTPPDAGLL
jgi:hypothetical protein